MGQDTYTRRSGRSRLPEGRPFADRIRRLVEMVLDEICEAIVRGETVKLSSFATFQVRDKNERIGRNPKTGEEVPIFAAPRDDLQGIERAQAAYFALASGHEEQGAQVDAAQPHDDISVHSPEACLNSARQSAEMLDDSQFWSA
jgi:hypothetical protein